MLRCRAHKGPRKFESFCFRHVGRLAESVDGTGPENRKSREGLVGSNPTSSANTRSGGEAVNAPVCKTGIRRSESGSELDAFLAQWSRASDF